MGFERGMAVAVLAAFGCGGDGGLPGNKRVGDLSKSEIETLCRDVDAKFTRVEQAFVEVTCTSLALLSPNCDSDRAQCIGNTPARGSLDGKVQFACTGVPGAVTQLCPDITVGELGGCLEETTEAIEAVVHQFHCGASTSDFTLPGTPSACSDLGARCTQLADGFSLQ